VEGFILLKLDVCVPNDMLKEQRWKEIEASHMEVQFNQNFLPSRSPPEPPNSTPHAGTAGYSQLSYKKCKCLPAIGENLRRFQCAFPVFKFQP